ncbi:Gfo/Idh/MocA family protein [Candidatus Latescibacterota bacterium]
MKSNKNIKRRDFIKASAVASIGIPCIVPSTVFGANTPGNRLTLGHIGVGSMGKSNMRRFLPRDDVQIVAVCDVDRSRRLEAKKLTEDTYAEKKSSGTYRGCDDYNDFREIISREDIDLVCIATPDHWHAIPAIMAANAGKDIYCEKPIALTITEGQAMCEAVRRNNIVWQTGSQQRSDRNFRFATELVRNGRIGKLHTVYVGLPNGSSIEPQPEMPVPEGFEYDFWLGPAPWAPYTEKRCHWNFRWIMDYSGGQLSDWAGHHCDIAHWGMNTEYTGPVEIEGSGEYPRIGLWNTALTYHFICKYANGLIMDVTNNKQNKQGVKFVGTDGWVFVNRQELDAEPKSLLTSIIGRDEIHLYRSDDHGGNFIDCVKSRKRTVAPLEILHRSVSIAHLGNIAMQLKRKLRWDPDNERFVNDPEADRMLSRAMRSPWHL